MRWEDLCVIVPVLHLNWCLGKKLCFGLECLYRYEARFNADSAGSSRYVLFTSVKSVTFQYRSQFPTVRLLVSHPALYAPKYS